MLHGLKIVRAAACCAAIDKLIFSLLKLTCLPDGGRKMNLVKVLENDAIG